LLHAVGELADFGAIKFGLAELRAAPALAASYPCPVCVEDRDEEVVNWLSSRYRRAYPGILMSPLESRGRLDAEKAALRQQRVVLQRNGERRRRDF
jgi:hypothetical protein